MTVDRTNLRKNYVGCHQVSFQFYFIIFSKTPNVNAIRIIYPKYGKCVLRLKCSTAVDDWKDKFNSHYVCYCLSSIVAHSYDTILESVFCFNYSMKIASDFSIEYLLTLNIFSADSTFKDDLWRW